MAIQNEPSRISTPFADAGTKNVIPETMAQPSAAAAASWQAGFPTVCSLPLSAGGIPPARNDFNGLFNQMTQTERFLQDGGVFAWDATTDYATNRLVLGSDGLLYWSLAQSGPNTGAGAQDPVLDNGTYWQLMPMNDANVVHTTGDETINGHKTFDLSTTTNSFFCVRAYDIDTDTPPNTALSRTIFILNDKNDKTISEIYSVVNNITSETAIRAWGTDHTTSTIISMRANANLREIVYFFADTLYPGSNGSCALGDGGNKWGQIYSTSGTINTSDARLKTEPESVPDEVLDAWGDVNFVQFQMLDRVEAKGADEARLHNGLIAQRIEEAFSAHGLDARRYGLFCWDEWEAEPEERDQDGNITRPALEAGDCYSLRYEEALCMEAAYQRRRADRAEARLAALEERLAAIEAKLC